MEIDAPITIHSGTSRGFITIEFPSMRIECPHHPDDEIKPLLRGLVKDFSDALNNTINRISDNSDKPTGFMGKSFDEMTKDEILDAFFVVWKQQQKTQSELDSFARNIHNIPTKRT